MQNNFPRNLTHNLDLALADTPVVLINGPRQSGKTTLAKTYQEQLEYFSLDDENLLRAVKQDPINFINNINRAIIDEIQRAPELLRTIKLAVDNDRQPGKFLLTGSANLLTLPQVGDSLAGRMEILTLLPLSISEIYNQKPDFLQLAQKNSWPIKALDINNFSILEIVLKGGYPEMLFRQNESRRFSWAHSYLKSIIERDIKDIAQIEKLVEMPRLLEILAKKSGNLTNFTQIGGQLNLDTKTTQKYIAILENLFLVKILKPWHNNKIARLIKTPKIYFIDSGLLACINHITHLAIDEDRALLGPLLETWVFAELLKLINTSNNEWQIFYYRDKDQAEIDFILENVNNKIIGIEVKASKTIFSHDFKSLRKLATLVGQQFAAGLILYEGARCLSFGDNLWAIPFTALCKSVCG